MRIASFEIDGKLQWGLVLKSPVDGQDWVFEPSRLVAYLRGSATKTSGYSLSLKSLLPSIEWPESIVDFLKLEDEGMQALSMLERFLIRYLEQGDTVGALACGYPIASIHLRAPIPAPRLLWGLVGNCTPFIRSNSERLHTNLYPMGHQRPCGAILGPGEYFYQPVNDGWGTIGHNVELAVIIGKEGRYIATEDALDYVAGYTVITDSQVNGLYSGFGEPTLENIWKNYDLLVEITASWGGKMADAHCPMGPYLVTKDEVGNVYDLLCYTKVNGVQRDRGHTSSLLVGVQKTIQWYSSFATLYPGDVIHLGTISVDGVSFPKEEKWNGPDLYVGSEIEKLGMLQNPVLDMNISDWRSEDDETKRIHISPAVRDVIRSGKTEIATPDQFSLKNVRHFFTVFKNYYGMPEREGLKLTRMPRFLAAPNSALGMSGDTVVLPPRSTDLLVSIELAYAVRGITSKVSSNTVDEAILGYFPMVSIEDTSFAEALVEPSTKLEKALPEMYGRWPDGFNCITENPIAMDQADILNREMKIEVEGIASATGNTSDYYSKPADMLPFITSYVTLFPGDIITMGSTAVRLRIPKEQVHDGMKIYGRIDGIGEVSIILQKEKN